MPREPMGQGLWLALGWASPVCTWGMQAAALGKDRSGSEDSDELEAFDIWNSDNDDDDEDN